MFCGPSILDAPGSGPVVGVSDEKHAASWKKKEKNWFKIREQTYCTEVQIKRKKNEKLNKSWPFLNPNFQ